MTAVLSFSTPHTRQVLIKVIEGFELAQLGPALMGSPCVLLNSWALQGRRELQLMKLESANYLSKRRASVSRPGEGHAKKRKGLRVVEAHTCLYILIFVTSFLNMVL